MDQYVPQQNYIEANIRALTNAIVPTDPNDYTTSYNASHIPVHKFIIYALDHHISIQLQLYHLPVPLSLPTAMMLDITATQLVNAPYVQTTSQEPFQNGGVFSHLSRKDRLKVLSALENLAIDLYLLPSPYKNNAGFIKYVTDALNRLSMFGYYSEWSGYGSTRLNPPAERRLEFFPSSWKEVGYPGVSLGYRDFRGFLLKMRGG